MSPATFSFRPKVTCLQQQALEKWVLGALGTIEHEQRVVQIAQKIFDLTWPLHGLGREERRLLRLAAVVHDVGRSIDDQTHPKQGARLLFEARHLPLRQSERRALAYLTRYHRGSVPAPGSDEILRSGDDRDMLRTVLALLRAADALDSRAIESPRLVFALTCRRLHVTCYLDQDTPKARKVYTRRKKFRLLEELLDCRVEVRIAQAHVLQMVA